MGEQLRSHAAAMTAVSLPYGIYDIFRYAERTDADFVDLVRPIETETLSNSIRIFHINGDEIERVRARLADLGERFADGYNIIVPAWELPIFPQVWADLLHQFDEVWALSHFIKTGLAAAGVESFYVGQSVEIGGGPFLPRRFFKIRESSFILLHFLDLSSYSSRKNPNAVLQLYKLIKERLPQADVQLVLKVKNAAQSAGDWGESLRREHPDVIFIDRVLSSYATQSLIRCCDCFVSLHRAEGFGRGLGEAMSLGRLALGTGWSGNSDFMTKKNSLFVRYKLTDVKPDEYPHSENQHWAEPDIKHAVRLLADSILDPDLAARIAINGRRDVLRLAGHRAVGLRTLQRLQALSLDK